MNSFCPKFLACSVLNKFPWNTLILYIFIQLPYLTQNFPGCLFFFFCRYCVLNSGPRKALYHLGCTWTLFSLGYFWDRISLYAQAELDCDYLMYASSVVIMTSFMDWDRVLWTFCPSWPQTAILPISASPVARIIGLSHHIWSPDSHFHSDFQINQWDYFLWYTITPQSLICLLPPSPNWGLNPGSEHARQAFYHSSHIPSPSVFTSNTTYCALQHSFTLTQNVALLTTLLA
jgi:hypothetical protein